MHCMQFPNRKMLTSSRTFRTKPNTLYKRIKDVKQRIFIMVDNISSANRVLYEIYGSSLSRKRIPISGQTITASHISKPIMAVINPDNSLSLLGSIHAVIINLCLHQMVRGAFVKAFIKAITVKYPFF